MEKRRFGRTGVDVSVLGFGAAPVAFLQTDRHRAAQVINFLLDSGVNLIDTAAAYPGSEEFLGGAVGYRRNDFVLISKCGSTIPESDAPEWSRRLILDSIDRSLRLLRTDFIDVMLLHTCDLDTLQKGEALGALAEARQAGKIRFAGYSGDNEPAAWAAAHPDVAVIETSINITDQRNIDLVLPVTRTHDVGVIAKRPVANAAWKKLADQPGMYRSYAQTYTERFAALKLRPSDLGFAGSDDEIWPQIALRFTLSFPEIHTAIIGTTKVENARENVRFAGMGPLPAQAVDSLRKAFQTADPKQAWQGLG